MSVSALSLTRPVPSFNGRTLSVRELELLEFVLSQCGERLTGRVELDFKDGHPIAWARREAGRFNGP